MHGGGAGKRVPHPGSECAMRLPDSRLHHWKVVPLPVGDDEGHQRAATLSLPPIGPAIWLLGQTSADTDHGEGSKAEHTAQKQPRHRAFLSSHALIQLLSAML